MRALSHTREHILRDVRTFVADSFCDGRSDGLGADVGLVTTGIVDSAGVVHLVEFLERRFGVTIADAEVGLANFNTLTAITALLADKLGLPPATAAASARPRRRVSK